VRSQIFDVITGATDSKLAKVTEVFPDLRRIEIELFGQLLRRDRLDPGSRQFIQAPQVNAQAVGGELRNFFSLHDEREKYNADMTQRKATRLRLKTYLRDNPPRCCCVPSLWEGSKGRVLVRR
jgi:hypothetical protein